MRFDEVGARYLRLTALSESGGRGPWTSAVEINVFGAAPPTSDRATRGSWGPVIGFPLVPAAAALLPGNTVLAWSSYTALDFGGSGQTVTATLDVAGSTVSQRTITSTGHDMLCPGTALLPDGRLVVTGGDDAARTSIYTPSNDEWRAAPDMRIPRGYHSTVTLSDGRIFALGGSWSGGRGGKDGEVYTDGAGWALRPGALVAPMLTADHGGIFRADNHGWFFAGPGGSVFQAGPSRTMHWYSTSRSGGVAAAGTRGTDADAMNGTAVMYDVGKILTVGGAPDYEDTTATANANVVDIGGGPTAHADRAVAGADGVRARVPQRRGAAGRARAGGRRPAEPEALHRHGRGDGPGALGPGHRPLLDHGAHGRAAHLVQQRAPAPGRPRLLTGGGGLCGTCALNHADAQIYSPPYPFNADGSAAARPAITAAPTSASPGTTISVTTDRPMARFALIRFGSSTHTVDTDQRRIPLAGSGGTSHSLRLPADTGTLVPGPYMLFALTSAGVPSVARTVSIR